jgi:hypothetical protein
MTSWCVSIKGELGQQHSIGIVIGGYEDRPHMDTFRHAPLLTSINLALSLPEHLISGRFQGTSLELSAQAV